MSYTLLPKELDELSPVKIERWIDIDSEDFREMDDNPGLTKKLMKIGFETGTMFTDSLGRIWGKGHDGKIYPFHFNKGKRLFGYRISKRAAN